MLLAGTVYRILSFADKIYDIAYDLFDMKEKDRKLLQDIGQKMREIDEKIFIKYITTSPTIL